MKNLNESGRSMVEMLGVLAIIGVLTIGAMSTVNYGIESFRVRAAYDLVEETARGVADLYSWKRSYLDAATKDASRSFMRGKVCKNIFDDKCEASETQNAATKTNWGMLVVEPDTESQFKLKLTNVPSSACNQLLHMDWVNVSFVGTDQTDNKCSSSVTTLNFTAY